MKNILFTDVRHNGRDLSGDGGTNVMVFTRLTAGQLMAAYRAEGSVTFRECYAVPDRDVRFYLYEPCWLSDAEERRALDLAG